jgi:hypothetical protein
MNFFIVIDAVSGMREGEKLSQNYSNCFEFLMKNSPVIEAKGASSVDSSSLHLSHDADFRLSVINYCHQLARIAPHPSAFAFWASLFEKHSII